MAQWDQYLGAAVTQMRNQRFPEVTCSVVIATTDEVSNPDTVIGGGLGQRTRARAATEPRVRGRGLGRASRATHDRCGGRGGV